MCTENALQTIRFEGNAGSLRLETGQVTFSGPFPIKLFVSHCSKCY